MHEVKAVLIIDDDEDDLFLIQGRLEEFVHPDCEFVTCHLKRHAVDFLRNRTFDLCILDHSLSGYNGLEILTAVQLDALATPIVMLTGQSDEAIAREAIRKGAQDYVMKSAIDDDIFEKSIRYAISRKELEFARSASREMQAESIAKDKFIAHLSHELRTPLTSILGYTSLLLENRKATPLFKELNIIQNNGQHLLGLLNDVLDLSKIAAGKFELRLKETDLQQVMIEVSSLVSVSAIDKGLSLDFTGLTLLPQYISLDDMRFKQVLVNIIGNAIKFTDSGGVTISMALKHAQNMNFIEICIEDTGTGMKPSQIKDIFAPFTQIEDVTNRKAGGAGLGLAITAEIVKQMKGELNVTSTLGEGSTFTLTLPVSFNKDCLIDYHFDYTANSAAPALTPQFHGSVLIVDDVFEIRHLVGHFVSQTGVDVEFASHGHQAITKIEAGLDNNQRFDLVLMDLHMPVLPGKKAVTKIRKDMPNLEQMKIIAMTAATQKGLDEELIQVGFDGLVSKPIDKQELWRLLDLHLPHNTADDVTNISAHQQAPQPTQHTVSQQHIHLVEDDDDAAVIMTILLENIGCRVTHSNTATQALSVAANNLDIDFHLLDLGLPDMSGEAMLAELNVKPFSGKLTILSGSQPSADLLRKYPIHKHLLKPVDKGDLVTLISKS